MMNGMTVKIAVSLPAELVQEARRAVSEGRAASVSAYVSEALRRAQEDSLARFVADLAADVGEPTAADAAWAAAVTANESQPQ